MDHGFTELNSLAHDLLVCGGLPAAAFLLDAVELTTLIVKCCGFNP